MNSGELGDALQRQCFDSRIARAMSLWCLGWLLVLVGDYLELTWKFVSELRGFHWILIVSPTFWLWVAAFAIVFLAVHRLMQLPWLQFEKGLSLPKTALLILLLPVILWLTLHGAAPYFYPAVDGYIRLVPFLGGRGYV